MPLTPNDQTELNAASDALARILTDTGGPEKIIDAGYLADVRAAHGAVRSVIERNAGETGDLPTGESR